MEIILCKYGCGNIAKFQLKNGSMCCSKSSSSCPSIRKKFSDNNCMKRPEMRIIAGNSMRGKKRDPNVIKIVAEKLRGRKHSEETKKKISLKAKGKIIPEHQKQMMRDNNPMKNPVFVKKMVESNKNTGAYIHDENRRNHMSKVMTKKFSEEKYKKLFSDKSKDNFKNPEYLEKLQKSLHLKPNKPETILSNLLKEIDLEKYQYTGNYSFWIDGKNPDFTNKNDKKVIEYFGGWWHDEKRINVSKENHELQRIQHYENNGYKCLIIWEDDLKDIKNVVTKILKFESI